MAEYIEREAAQKVAERYGCTNGATLGIHSGLADCIASEIEALPAADVAPVRHGRWEKYKYATGFVHCSVCRDVYIDEEWITDGKWNYCPNCGARMDGGESNERMDQREG